jgi:hypothetical protein
MASLIFVSPSQIDLWIPPGIAPVPATVEFPVTGLPPGAGAVQHGRQRDRNSRRQFPCECPIPGLDQVNVPLGLNLRGSGLVNVSVTVDGVTSNAVQIDIQ